MKFFGVTPFPVVIFYKQVEIGIRHHYHRLPNLSPEHLHVHTYPLIKTNNEMLRALAAWHSGHRIRLRNRRPGFESRQVRET
jgi:hypothetical protein